VALLNAAAGAAQANSDTPTMKAMERQRVRAEFI
jgi:hypothetical protein